MSYQRVKYKLINHDIGNSIWLQTDPRNWDESEKTLKRSDKTFGVYTELSKDLEFTKDGYEFLKIAYSFKDIEANVTLEEWRVHPHLEYDYLHSTGVFDFSGYKENKTVINLPFKSGGLNALIQSQLKEKFELNRTEAINGDTIPDLNTVTVALTSREILLVSELKTNENDTTSTAFRMNFRDGNTRTGALGIPVDITVNSDDKLGAVIRNSFTTTPNDGLVETMFYFNNDLQKTFTLRIRLKCTIKVVRIDDLDNEFFHVSLAKFNNGTTPELVSRTTLLDVPFSQIRDYEIDIDQTQTITLLAGESLSLQWYGGGDFGGFLDDGDLNLDFENTEAIINITEDSYRDPSQCQAALFHEAGDKMMQIITGEQGRFYSEFYGRTDLGYNQDGEFSLTALTSGFWIRQFTEKPIEMSLNGYIETSNAIHNTGYTIEVINGKECLVVEDMRYFFQDAVAISLPNQVTNVEREAATDFCDSALEFGYKKPADNGSSLYEEAMGLDEYNTSTSYTTPLKRVDSKYSKVSEARADSYGKEFARRKLKINYPTTDTRYDSDLHLLDLKKGLGLAYEERTWQDDFSTAPQNVYSPNTATNLRLTPYRISQRHEWFYGAGLYKHQTESIRFASSGGNSELVTQKAGETPKSERSNTLISTLQRPKFVNQWITFEHPVDFYVNEQVYGKTNVNGRQIPNYFFKVEFINEYQQKETGYLFELSPNSAGKWKLLKAL